MELILIVTILSFFLQSTIAQGGQLSEILSYDSVLHSECSTFIETCPPTRTSCASAYCNLCTGFGSKIKSCCAQATPAQCFAGLGGAGAPVTTPATASSQGSGGNSPGACGELSVIYAACESLTPGFDDLQDNSAASCLCYESSTWKPDLFDNIVETCALSWSAAGDLTEYSTLMSLNNFCSSVGDVVNGAAAATTTAQSEGATITSQAQTGATASSPSLNPTTTSSASAATSSSSNGSLQHQALEYPFLFLMTVIFAVIF